VTINGASTFANVSPTITPGTANGVAYLNGSKVLTTGSALTFDGSSMVLNTSTSSNALRITQTGTGNALLVEDSTNPDSTPFVIDASGRIIQGYTTAILTADDYNGVTRTGWGYQGNGTATAGALFTSWNTTSVDVGAGISLSRSRSATIGTQGIVASGDSLGGIGFNGDDGTSFISAASITSEVDGTPGTNDLPGRLVFSTTADGASTPTERMRLDSSGNLGLGVTPSAWVGTGNQRAIQISTVGSISSLSNATGNQQLNLGRNVYDFYSAKYLTSDTASAFRMLGDNTFAWYQAASGTAGNAITFTQAMTLDASGNLGVGTSSPDSKLVVQGGSGTYAQIKDGTVNTFIQARSADSVGVVGTLTNHSLAFWTNSASRMTLDTSGNLGLGVLPTAYTINSRVFQIDGGANAAEIKLTNNTSGASGTTGAVFQMAGNDLYIWNTENSFLSFGTNAAERARITSGGDLLVGTTSNTINANGVAVRWCY
jgi:hypothetical protein